MNKEKKNRDRNSFLYQAVNIFISLKVWAFLYEAMGNDSLLEPVSSGHSNCSVWHFMLA